MKQEWLMAEAGKDKARILVVEDSADFKEFLKLFLGVEGYSVVCASNGREALDYLRSSDDLPDLILLDMMMPVMDGYQFRMEQKGDPRLSKIPVIGMSAAERDRHEKDDMVLAEMLLKPMEVDTLLSCIKRHSV
jgi:CheY-like chemotaxis protein